MIHFKDKNSIIFILILSTNLTFVNIQLENKFKKNMIVQNQSRKIIKLKQENSKNSNKYNQTNLSNLNMVSILNQDKIFSPISKMYLSQVRQEKTITIKDISSIVISILALLLSIYATINTEIKTRVEKNRTIRLQLTDILGRITKLNLENAKYIKDYGETDPKYVSNISSMLNQENASLLWQAQYLSKEIPDLISPVDLNTIAIANQHAGNLFEADSFHRQGIKKAEDNNDDYSQILATRSYANFLFSIGKTGDGREKYKTAISLLQSLPTQGQNDLIPHTNGITYQLWAISELVIGNKDNANKHFNNAEREFSRIENSFMKDTALKALNYLKEQGGDPTANGQKTTPSV